MEKKTVTEEICIGSYSKERVSTMQDEIESIMKNQVWNFVDLLPRQIYGTYIGSQDKAQS